MKVMVLNAMILAVSVRAVHNGVRSTLRVHDTPCACSQAFTCSPTRALFQPALSRPVVLMQEDIAGAAEAAKKAATDAADKAKAAAETAATEAAEQAKDAATESMEAVSEAKAAAKKAMDEAGGVHECTPLAFLPARNDTPTL